MKKIKNKTKAILAVLAIIGMQTLAFAESPAQAQEIPPFPSLPIMVAGQVFSDGLLANGASVVLTNTRTGASLMGIVGAELNKPGWYFFDLNNLSQVPANGDVINVVATMGQLQGLASSTYNSAIGIMILTPINLLYIQPPPVCQTGADTSGDSIISMGELLQYVSDWKIGNVSLSLLLKAIGFWKAGAGC